MTRMTVVLVAACLCALPTGCGSMVSGHTYHNNGGVVQVEFKSGGKAYVSAGSIVHSCSYSESGKSVSLVCDGDTTDFKVQDDGALVGPAAGLMARLTLVQN